MKRVMSTPAARRVAGERRIDISAIRGTGEGGYVQLSDVLAFKGGKATFLARAVAEYLGVDIHAVTGDGTVKKADVLAYKERMGQDRVVPLDNMRKTIARRMAESLRTAAQYTIMSEADCFELKKFMKAYTADCLAATGIKPTYTDLLLKACAVALKKNPMINSYFMDDHLLLKGDVNIGIAVSLGEKGLIVPNIKNVHMLSLQEITEKRAAAVERARAGKLAPEEYEGGTFTLWADAGAVFHTHHKPAGKRHTGRGQHDGHRCAHRGRYGRAAHAGAFPYGGPQAYRRYDGRKIHCGLAGSAGAPRYAKRVGQRKDRGSWETL